MKDMDLVFPQIPFALWSQRMAIDGYFLTTYFLLLNRTKVVGGRELPCQLNAPPWRIPTNSHPKSSQINAVLSKSMEVQSSHVPDCHGHGDFQV